MASPQLEDGHLAVANELWEALSAAALSPSEWSVLFAIVRQTYGWQRKTTECWASMDNLAAMTGLHRSRCSEAMKGLRAKKIVALVHKADRRNNKPNVYTINKDWESWEPDVLRLIPASRNTGGADSRNTGEPDGRTSGGAGHGVPADREPRDTSTKNQENQKKNASAKRTSDADLSRIAAGYTPPPPIPPVPPPDKPMAALAPSDIWAACNRGGAVPHDRIEPLQRIIEANDEETVRAVLESDGFLNADRRLTFFFACFRDDGVKRERKTRAARNYYRGPVEPERPPPENAFEQWCRDNPDGMRRLKNLGISAAEAERELPDAEVRDYIANWGPLYPVPAALVGDAVKFAQRWREVY